jgi:hypothetical protein
MQMYGQQRQRLAGLNAVDPSTVSGVITIAGEKVAYKNGAMTYQGQLYAVSDSNDFVISSKNIPIGAIIGGVLVPIDQLTAAQSAYFQKKYGYTL